MPDQDPIPSPMEEDGQIDIAILWTLLHEPRPWSVDEVAREVGQDPVDSLNRLYGGGLIHRHDRFVWPTRAAVMAEDLR
jgi:predicted transcriptional regulator